MATARETTIASRPVRARLGMTDIAGSPPSASKPRVSGHDSNAIESGAAKPWRISPMPCSMPA